MLVLTRCREEEIRIGDDIVIRIIDVKGDRVRIGIAAPSHVPVHRQEVYLEIERANREALKIAGSGLEKAREMLDDSRARAKGASPAALKHPVVRQRERKVVDTEVAHGA